MDSLGFTALLLTKFITVRIEKLKLENQLLKLFYLVTISFLIAYKNKKIHIKIVVIWILLQKGKRYEVKIR